MALVRAQVGVPMLVFAALSVLVCSLLTKLNPLHLGLVLVVLLGLALLLVAPVASIVTDVFVGSMHRERVLFELRASLVQ